MSKELVFHTQLTEVNNQKIVLYADDDADDKEWVSAACKEVNSSLHIRFVANVPADQQGKMSRLYSLRFRFTPFFLYLKIEH